MGLWTLPTGRCSVNSILWPGTEDRDTLILKLLAAALGPLTLGCLIGLYFEIHIDSYVVSHVDPC